MKKIVNKTMKYAQIRNMDISNGIGIGVSFFTSGCPYRCKKCHNSELWNFNSGKSFTFETNSQILKLIEPEYITRFSILGGEALLPQNVSDLALLIHDIKVKREDIKVWLWTGTTFEDLYKLTFLRTKPNDEILDSLGWDNRALADLAYILNNIDYMIDGRFIQEQKDLTLKFRGSKNQRWLNMKKSIAAGQAISVD